MSVDSVNSGRKGMKVLYGSQTGTAEDTAERIGRDAIRCRIHVDAKALDDYQIVSVVRRS